MATVMRASQAQRDRTKLEEGCRLESYPDPASALAKAVNRLRADRGDKSLTYRDVPGWQGISGEPWTVAYGHASTNPNPVRGVVGGQFYEGRVVPGLVITSAEAERLFDLVADQKEREISELVTAPISQSQMDALFDFCYQFGVGALGGSTLITQINKNPNNLGTQDNRGILHQFMRWTRAGGSHQEYVWRRSARRACVYAGAPIPQPLWQKSGFPFSVNNDDEVDYSITPTIYKLIEYGRKKAAPPSFPPPKPEASVTIITDTPAAPPQATAKAGTQEDPTPQPRNPPASPAQNPASVPSGPTMADAGPAVQAAPAPPVSTHPGNAPVPKVTFPKDEPKAKAPVVIAPKAIDPKSIPYGDVDPSLATNMSDSRRVAGMVVVGLGSMTQILAAREIISSSVGAVFYDMSRDPIVVALFVGGVFWVVGWLTRKRGTQIVTKGMVEARSVLK